MTDSANLYVFSDREFLHLVEDVAREGWATSHDIAEQIWPKRMAEGADNGAAQHAKHCVAIRLAWMRRYGCVEKREYSPGEKQEKPGETEWGLTEAGRLFMRGRLSQAQEAALEGSGEDQTLALMSWLATNYRSVSALGANMIRREWMHGAARRR